MTNETLLDQAIANSGLKKSYIASQMHISLNSLRNKISGKVEFKASEVLRMQELLGLDNDQTRDIFLLRNVI